MLSGDERYKLLQGDACKVLQSIPDESIDCCVTSPPYYGLRDYGSECQIGLENTPKAYIDRLLSVFREIYRVLKPDGTCWVNIGDSYAAERAGTHQSAETLAGGKSGHMGDGSVVNRGRHAGYNPTRNAKAIGVKHKDLIGIPWMLAFALRDDGWYLRQDIIWHKPNPMPESVKDRCTKSHEYLFLLSKNQRYYFDHEAMQETAVNDMVARTDNPPRYGGNKYTKNPETFYRTKSGNAYAYTGKRNRRDVWTISTQPSKYAHFATFPEKLIEPCILSGCKAGGGVVIDPFNGSGTTGVVALKNDRKYIGIELNKDYIEMSNRRLEEETGQISVFEIINRMTTGG